MVARVKPQGELAVIFSRDGEEPETKIVPTGGRAAVVAVMMIAGRGELIAGDQLLVQRYDGEG